MSYSLPVNITILLSFIIFVLYLLGTHNILTSFPQNDCEMTFMFQYPQFVEISMSKEIEEAYPKYALYSYGEGGVTEQLRKMKFKGIPVLFIPGSSGSHKQGRSLASISLRKSLNSRTPFHFNYFMINFDEEQSAFFGGVLEDQTKYASYCIKKILTLYQNSEQYKKPESVILIGHSLGGLVTKSVFLDAEFDPKLVHLIISLATPHKYPLIQPDFYISNHYKKVNDFWKNNTSLEHINIISIGGGFKDLIVHSDVTFDSNADINVLTTAIPGVWLPNDHLSIMWCKQLILTIVRAIFDSIDISTKQLSLDKKHVNSVFQYHFVKRSAGKKFSGSLVSRFSSFERSQNWYENLQRQFTVVEANGVKSNHYIMIRLFSDPKSEAVFIEGYNINVRDWIFVCNADVVYNSIRMCDNGENLSNMTEIAPVDPKLMLRRKFVYLNLFELKAKSFTHVLVRLPPSDSHMVVNVDVHQPSERNINHKVPKFYSFSSDLVILSTENNSGYYAINLVGLEDIWQAFTLKVKVLSCKSSKNNAVVSFIIPWSHEDQHFTSWDKDYLTATLSLTSPKPKNFNSTLYPFVRFHLDPTCKYQMTLQSSIIGMFAQGARYYTPLLPAFMATVAVLTVRQQMKHLDEVKCVLFHSALSSAVRHYHVILQASILGSKLLGIGFCLLILPMPDFLILQDFSLDSFFMSVLLYAVAVITVYSLGAVIYVTIIISGQAAHKMALRFLAKAISGIFNWSEWVISILHQVPVLVATLLISLAISTSGALALWLGAFFYFLKLCKMYEEYLENLFNYSVKLAKKLIAKKVKNIASKPKSTDQIENESQKENKTKPSEKLENDESEISVVHSSAVMNNAETEIDLLSSIHFHISLFVIWLLIASLYIPSLLMWAKNYYFNITLQKDPALLPSIIVSASGAVLWQPGVPKSCSKLSKITSSTLFILAVASIIYSSFSLYRLGFILSASLLVVSFNQITSKVIN